MLNLSFYYIGKLMDLIFKYPLKGKIMTVLRGNITLNFFDESDNVEVKLEAKGNGVDVAPLEIWQIDDDSIVTVAGPERLIDPPKKQVQKITPNGDGKEWYYLPRGKYEAVLPRIVIPDDVVVLGFPRSTFNRFHGYHFLPTALWDSGFAARGTLCFEVKVKELRIPSNEPLFQLVAFKAEEVGEKDLYKGYWQEKGEST